ncbi:hypothetical protein [Dietzia natronolimnaea]|uniref:hypothetical protein n=1 Tax=Dietzia natronolimnaea TaxID=161920 RepID=UPI0015F9F9C5|nr:hypothetical protein [Dietzia natronolimnaea]MBB1037385.1 hypothetical protein [Dietzia natronolimnaea]
MNHYDPNNLRPWFLEKLWHKDRAKIDAAHHAVVVRESGKACEVQWLSEAGDVVHEAWVPKRAMELRAGEMPRVPGEDALKTELREWMWERGLPSDGTDSLQELENEILWHGQWAKLPKRFRRPPTLRWVGLGHDEDAA